MIRRLFVLALLGIAACGGSRAASRPADYAAGLDAPPAHADQVPEAPWPRRLAAGDTSFALYPPELDGALGRSAIEVTSPSGTSYGVAWIEGGRVVRASFPAAKDHEAAWFASLRDSAIAEGVTIGAAPGRVVESTEDDPPKILFVDHAALLVPIDGAPIVRADHGVSRVLNTRAFVVREDDAWWISVGDRWFRRASIDGEYAAVGDGVAPAGADKAKAALAAIGAIDLFASERERTDRGLTVIVATSPTEVIETRGAEELVAIAGTTLSYVSNTDSDVFRDAGGTTYVLLSGRWYRRGPSAHDFVHVASGDLPPDFARIPNDHPKATVLASVAGTPRAEEALIASEIPETATIERSGAHLAVAYDGAPRFEPVAGTSAPLSYAVNAATPVVATGGLYYAVESGVWFVAADPAGPWVVATSVPAAVYTIPIACPIHYVTYVRVYGEAPGYVFVGYTPGYFGAIASGGVVVWGTGYVYRPWIGRVWYGRPLTWGFGVRVGAGATIGWRAPIHPWWGPERWAAYPHVRGAFVARGEAYRQWGAVAHAPPAHPNVAHPSVAHPGAQRPSTAHPAGRAPRSGAGARPSRHGRR